MYVADTVSDEIIQKGFFFLLRFKVWSHSSLQIWVTGTLTYPTIVFISISKFEIFSSNSLVIALLFHISFEPNKSLSGFKKRRFMLIKGEERCLQTGASSSWGPREARTWSCLLKQAELRGSRFSSGEEATWGGQSLTPSTYSQNQADGLGHETAAHTRGANWIKEGTFSSWGREKYF